MLIYLRTKKVDCTERKKQGHSYFLVKTSFSFQIVPTKFQFQEL